MDSGWCVVADSTHPTLSDISLQKDLSISFPQSPWERGTTASHFGFAISSFTLGFGMVGIGLQDFVDRGLGVVDLPILLQGSRELDADIVGLLRFQVEGNAIFFDGGAKLLSAGFGIGEQNVI